MRMISIPSYPLEGRGALELIPADIRREVGYSLDSANYCTTVTKKKRKMGA